MLENVGRGLWGIGRGIKVKYGLKKLVSGVLQGLCGGYCFEEGIMGEANY